MKHEKMEHEKMKHEKMEHEKMKHEKMKHEKMERAPQLLLLFFPMSQGKSLRYWITHN